MAQQTSVVPWELRGIILYAEGHYSSDTDVLNTSPGKSNARASLTNVQKPTWQQSAPWHEWPRWAFPRQKTSKDKSAASYTRWFQTPRGVKGWESDGAVRVVSMWLPSVRATWGEQYGAPAAPSPRAAVVVLHWSRGRDRALVPQLRRAHWMHH